MAFVEEGDPVELVGRARELAGAREQLAGGCPLVVTGEPGMGKSAFLGVLARQLAEERGLPVFRVRAADFGLRSDVTLLRLLGACGEAGARALGDLVGQAPATVPDTVVHMCRQLFLAYPAVVVVDGVPTDSAANDLLADLVSAFSRTSSVLLMGSTDARPPQGAPVALCHLRPLDRTDSATLVGEAAGHPALTSAGESLDGLVEATRGLPLLARIVGAQVAVAVSSGRPPTPVRLPAPAWMADEARKLLETLSALDTEEFPAELLDTLAQRPGAVHELCRYELLQPAGEGVLRLPPVIRSLVDRNWSDAELRDRSADAERALAAAAEANPAAYGGHPAAVVDLVGRPAVPDVFADSLAHHLARHGRLAEVLVLRQLLWVRTGRVTPDAHLAVAARESGQPERVPALPAGRPADDEGVLEQAVTAHHMGRLRDADAHLSALPSGRGADPWVLLTRAAVLCDRGDLRAVGPLLRRAVEAHQVRGDRRGEAWTVFQYGRLCLLRGEVEDAEKLLHSAREEFHTHGESRGVAWAATELGRLSLQLGTADIEGLYDARLLHEVEGDPRGAVWAHLWWILAMTDAPGFLWEHEFPAVTNRFREVGDRLGEAWALHHHALALGRTSGTADGRSEADPLFDEALRLFEVTDCVHGTAWTLLERALHDPARRFPQHRWAGDIRHWFGLVGDEAGEAWVELAESATGSEPSYELAARYPADLLDAVEWAPNGNLRIPRAARYTQPEPRADAHDPEASRSRVRVTLLDGTPTRIALEIVSGARHPWSTDQRPALTARAVPLTLAEVEPLHAISTEGAEFRFVPRLPGRHRIRFTITDQATGTVLQQVETEIDVWTIGPAPRTAVPEEARRATAAEPAWRA
ncbi:hypothetical protein AB9Q10_13930 [Streptomyces krungchingensis]|uniref:hypothetical protein n=1 Tax=Streptomyces krungchingensis TaxID=1565034 RepID=UPI003CF905A7